MNNAEKSFLLLKVLLVKLKLHEEIEALENGYMTFRNFNYCDKWSLK